MCKLIELIQQIHIHHVIHRDLKPQNIMLDDEKKVYIIDFGLSSICATEDGIHIPENRENTFHQHIVGNTKYMSYYMHLGYDAVRRDDMISIGYIYMQLLFGKLPWDNLKSREMSDLPDTHIMHPTNQLKKKEKSWDNIVLFLQQQLEDKNIENKNIYRYLKYCYFLSFSNIPLYETLIELFRSPM
jgi:serine/threonine protein kinase